jgi:alkanesulfonate monooxygenase SsuD/methylene tetrahydromethanopterin reductase-like flavin-dependent oxidoreductase (luciferase family)
MEFGAVLPVLADPATGNTPSWENIREHAVAAEELGFDTVWVADELLWRVDSWPEPVGWWECVSILGAVAEATSTIKVGSWVLSALHRNPGLTAKVAATIDEVSGGRFVLGFGAGHSGAQGKEFGYPPDKTVSRYEEALEILVPLLREGKADLAGEYHAADGLEQIPPGPRPGGIPIMLGGHGPRNIGLAVKHADIWSAFATASSRPDAFVEMLAKVDQACEEAGRDPKSLARSIGVVVEPTESVTMEEVGFGVSLNGTAAEIAESFNGFAEMGVNYLELMTWPQGQESLEKAAEAMHLLDV